MLRIGMFFFSLAVVAGVFFANSFAELSWWYLLGGLAGACVLALWSLYAQGAARSLLRALPMLLVVLGVGVLHGGWRTHQAVAQRVAESVTEPVRLRGHISSLVSLRQLGAQHRSSTYVYDFEFSTDADQPFSSPSISPGQSVTLRTRAYSDSPLQLNSGDVLDVWLRLAPPLGLVNQFGPDSERMNLANGIAGYARVEQWVSITSGQLTLNRWREKIATRIQLRLADQISAGSPSAGLIPALVVGDRRALSASHWQVFQATGISHLVAISGLHISLVAMGVWWLSSLLIGLPLARWQSNAVASQWALAPAVMAASSYAALAGFALPTQRALVMLLVVMGSHALRWRVSVSTNVLVALCVVLTLDPLSALSGGFWLSFLAVGLLAVLLQSGGQRSGEWKAGLHNALRMQVVLSLGTGALAAWLFSGWSLVAIPVNLLLVPVFTFVLIPLSLLGSFLPESVHLLDACTWGLDLIWPALQGLVGLPSLPPPVTAFSLVALLLCLLRSCLPALPGPRWLLLGLLVPWVFPASNALDKGDFELLMFDVGQGQMSAIRTRNHFLLYDTGPTWPEGSAVGRILQPWLARHRITPSLAFVSHGDDDHDGGLAELLTLWPRMPVFSGEAGGLGDAGSYSPRVPNSLPCYRGQHWQFDGVSVRVLWPLPSLPMLHSNNHSCVVKIEGEHGSVLLTGDIEAPVEFWLADQASMSDGLVRSDILQVAHHGSRTSSTYTFLRAVRPRYAAVASGYRNAFHHPATQTQQRYAQFNVPLLNTAQTGMQIYRIDVQNQISVRQWRLQSSWPWRVAAPVVE